MIILEFLIFVVSSGLFCSEKFRHHIWAVLIAGAIATGSSLLFAYDLGRKMMGHEKEPPVVTKLITQTITKPGPTSDPITVGKPHSCEKFYPDDSVRHGEEGITRVAFKVLVDGTVDHVTVTGSSGSEALDAAAVQCVSNWHYRPALKDGDIVEKDWKAKVTWKLATAEQLKAEALAKPAETPKPENETKTEEQVAVTKDPATENTHHWYNPLSWFGGSSDKKDADKKPDEKKPDSP